MTIDFTPSWLDTDLASYRDTVERFVETEMQPGDEAARHCGHVGHEIWRLAGALGMLCVDIPEAYGGAGLLAVRQQRVGSARSHDKEAAVEVETESAYLPPHEAGRARRLAAADKRRWTEPPLVRWRAGLLGNVSFRRRRRGRIEEAAGASVSLREDWRVHERAWSPSDG